MKKSVVVIISCIILFFAVVGFVIFSFDEPEVKNVQETQIVDNNNAKAPSKVYSNEKNVTGTKKAELFNFIPKMYSEEFAPFTSQFMLTAAMDKIISTDEGEDYTTKYVDNMVTKIFGRDAKINKEEVSNPDVSKSIYYYSKEAGTYAVIPVGYEGIFKFQILKNVTETDEAYYVYTYSLIGGYSYDEDSISRDEFGDINYENAKVQVIVGDKDGKDIVHVFDNYNEIYDEDIWLNNFSNIMPVYRYTLKKEGRNYFLTEVEQINY